MHVAVTGATGFIGSALVPHLRQQGHTITRLTRSTPTEPDEAQWDPGRGTLDADVLRDVDAVVHLAGAPIAGGPWTKGRRRLIRDSRIDGTSLLARTLAAMDAGPGVLVCSSGIDFYGDRGDEILTEDSGRGQGFLAEVCEAWEAAADPARAAGARVVHLRTGIVCAGRGGALPKLLLPFRLGVGGRLGDGRQYMSWLTRDDLLDLFVHALTSGSLSGPVNAVAPNPVTNAEFTRVAARVLRRPALVPVPRFAPRLVLGEMADVLLFDSKRALPQRASDDGFTFHHPTLEEALRHVLGR